MKLLVAGFSNPHLAPYTGDYANYLIFVFSTFGSKLHLNVLQENTKWYHSQIPYEIGKPQPND